MNDILIILILFAAGCAGLLIVGWLDERIEERSPNYVAGWARVFGETEPPRSHVTLGVPCRACHRIGQHDQGCSLLDRLDAGEVRP